ncbi:MAG: PAS domain S-box protein, partial [Roseimicrobium sp.]
AAADDYDQTDDTAADGALWRSALPLIALDKSGRIVQFSRGAVALLPQDSQLGGEAWFWQLVPATGQQDAFLRHVQSSLHRVLDDGASQSVIFTYTAGAPAPSSASAIPLQWLVSRLEGGLPHVEGDVALVVGLTGTSPFAPAVAAAPSSGGLNEELNFELRRQSEENARLRVAEKQATESELVSRQREARLRAVLELAPCGLMVLDEHARPIYRNAQCVALLGRDLAEGQLVESWLTEGSRDEAHRTEIARQWSEGVWRKQLALPLPLVSSDGLLKEVEMRPVSLPGGGLLVMMHDVTEFRRSEEMLRSAEAKYRAVVHENPLPMVLADRTGAVFDVNPAAEALLGHTRAELRCIPLENWLTPEALAQRALSLQQLHEQGERSAEAEVRILHREGYTFPVNLRLSVVPDAAGQPIFTIHYFSPLPEPPAAPSVATPTEARHVESHTSLLLSTDVHGRIAAWTDEAQERFGFDAAEMLGRGLHTLFRPSDPTGFYTELLQVVGNDLDQPQAAQWTYSHKTDGRQTGPFLVQRLAGGPSINLLEELMVLTPVAATLHAPEPEFSIAAPAPHGARLVQAPLSEPVRPSLEELKRERILLGETHHRVKNHLQIITSMLTLQMSTLHNEDAREALRSSQNRIRAIASLHQHLFKLVTEGAGEFRTFLAELIGHLRACYDIAETQVRVQIHLPDKPVPEEWLMPLALAINEMVSNAFKHAFPAHRRGSMSVELNW